MKNGLSIPAAIIATMVFLASQDAMASGINATLNGKVGFNLTYMPKKAIEKTTNSEVVDPTLSGILFLQFKVSLDQLIP